jgi:hypothetical protein
VPWIYRYEVAQFHLNEDHVIGDECPERLIKRALGSGKKHWPTPMKNCVPLNRKRSEVQTRGMTKAHGNDAAESSKKSNQQENDEQRFHYSIGSIYSSPYAQRTPHAELFANTKPNEFRRQTCLTASEATSLRLIDSPKPYFFSGFIRCAVTSWVPSDSFTWRSEISNTRNVIATDRAGVWTVIVSPSATCFPLITASRG